jgi:hypothetical protein
MSRGARGLTDHAHEGKADQLGQSSHRVYIIGRTHVHGVPHAAQGDPHAASPAETLTLTLAPTLSLALTLASPDPGPSLALTL